MIVTKAKHVFSNVKLLLLKQQLLQQLNINPMDNTDVQLHKTTMHVQQSPWFVIFLTFLTPTVLDAND